MIKVHSHDLLIYTIIMLGFLGVILYDSKTAVCRNQKEMGQNVSLNGIAKIIV